MRRLNGRATDSPAESNPAAQDEAAGGPPRERPGVLVVDDEHLVRVIVQLGLERDGFEVWTAASGREAIDLYQEHREDIAAVLLDVRMPGLDGPATLDALRELCPEIRACFMTGGPVAYDPEALRQRGAAYFIAKPFHLDHLANVLRLLVQAAPADLLPSGVGRRR
jgi:CheY-like chemotaxis protein